jgi:hypothetical protein
VITASIYFLTTWNTTQQASNEERQTQSEVQVETVHNETGGSGRDGEKNGTGICKMPMENSGIAPVSKAKEDKRLIEDINNNYASKDRMTEHVREKATQSDESTIPFYLWNDRVVEQLNEHWTSRGMVPTFDINDRIELLKVTRALQLL